MKFVATVSLVVFAALQLALVRSASAEDLTWHFRSEHEHVVSVELYSDDRNHIWPGNDEVYTLDDSRTKSIHIACRSGEKICYGAWVRNTASSTWGAGRGGKGECSKCCYVCDGGETPVLVLK